MRQFWSFTQSALKEHWPKVVYCVFVLIFWILPYWPNWIPSSLPEARTLEMWGAILLLPAAILSSRLRGAGETLEGAVDVLVESIVAVATAFLLVGIERQMSEPPLKPLIEKIPELSLVTILVFAVQIVSKSTSAVKYAKEQIEEQVGKLQGGLVRVEGAAATVAGASSTVENASGAVTKASQEIAKQLTALQNLSGNLNNAAALMQSSAKQVAEARYAAVAARLLGLKHQDRLYVSGPNGELISDQVLAPVTERALDSIQAWIQTGLHIETARNAGPRGRETWWRLMEAYHREEVFDVSQQEIATNVRSFAMMLLVVISEYLREPGRLIIVNVSKFPPKDFYNFPNGKPGNRFYHEPEFFGTYRRALAILAGHPDVSAKRIILCSPKDEIDPSTTESGTEIVKKMAYDCALWNFLPTPLTFEGTATAMKAACSSEGLRYLEAEQGAVRSRLPHGVGRVLITPHSTWVPATDTGDSVYYKNLLDKNACTHAGMRARFIQFQQDAKDLLANGLSASTEGAGAHKSAGITAHLDLAWTDLLSRALGLDQQINHNSVTASTLLSSIRALHQSLGTPGALSQESQPVSRIPVGLEVYREQYYQYLDSILSANDDFQACIKLATSIPDGTPGTPQYTASQADQAKELAGKVLSLLHLGQAIDTHDKYFDLVLGTSRGPAPIVASTGLRLGFAENWVHRALVYIEATLIADEVKTGGALPLWRLLATDLCGMGEVGKHFDSFISNLPAHIRMCDSTLKEDLFDEFLLVGVIAPTTKGGDMAGVNAETGLSGIRWRALVGTNISEPFHTCRIQFDFGDYSSTADRPVAAAGNGLDSKGSDRRSPLELHADWAVDAWNDDEATGKFIDALKAKWHERTQDETSLEKKA